MTFPFDPHQGLIVVRTEIAGPSGNAVLRLALDTGASRTLINAGLLVAVGCDPASSADRVEVTTASGFEFPPLVSLSKISALGHTRDKFAVLAHTLPPSSGVDGLLGLDFFRGQDLSISFRKGHVRLI